MSMLSSVDELYFGVTASDAVAVPIHGLAAQTIACEALSDHALLEATRAGDETAFAEIVNRYRNQITNYIYRMTNDYDGAVDLAQETFVRVYGAMQRYRTDYAFSTYIYRIATNLAISELRKRKRRRLVSLTTLFIERGQAQACEFDPPDAQPLQDIALIDRERRTAVASAISTLPEKYRAPLILRDVEGKSYQEIACILETSEGTIKSRISRARSFLRDKLRAYL